MIKQNTVYELVIDRELFDRAGYHIAIKIEGGYLFASYQIMSKIYKQKRLYPGTVLAASENQKEAKRNFIDLVFTSQRSTDD